MARQKNIILVNLLVNFLTIKNFIDGFSVVGNKIILLKKKPKTSLHFLSASTPHDILQTSTLLTWNTENARQYVPLAVICAVILDILCGSPFANLLLAPMRRAATTSNQSPNDTNSLITDLEKSATQRSFQPQTNAATIERIDTVAVAEAAIQKAKNALELRKFLDDNKTDKDRMEDLRKKIDSQLRSLDKS
jgi:hypothetical protein